MFTARCRAKNIPRIAVLQLKICFNAQNTICHRNLELICYTSANSKPGLQTVCTVHSFEPLQIAQSKLLYAQWLLRGVAVTYTAKKRGFQRANFIATPRSKLFQVCLLFATAKQQWQRNSSFLTQNHVFLSLFARFLSICPVQLPSI